MPALPPDEFPPPFLTPANQEQYDVPPAFSQQNVDMVAAMRPHLEALSSLSAQMRDNFEGIGKLLEQNVSHVERMGNAQQKNARISQQEFEVQKRNRDLTEARAQAMERITKAEQRNNDALTHQLRLAGMYRKGQIEYQDEQGKLAQTTVADYRNNPALRQRIREQAASNLSSALAADNNRFSFTEVIQHLAHGNIGAALGEAMQQLPGTAGMIGRLEGLGERTAARGAAMGGLGGLMTQGVGALIGRGLPFLASPAGLFLIQRELRQGIRTYQEDLRRGMQGGLSGSTAARESLGADIRSRFEGINPFDALTQRMAAEIAHGIQSEGFTGRLRAAWQDSVTDVVKSTGMDAGQALQLMATSANTLGQSASQFRSDMELVKNTAHDTTLSVTQVAQAMQQMQTAFYARGGQPATAQAGIVSNVLQRALPRRIAISGRLGGAIAQNWQTLVARAGINPALAFEPQILKQATRILDQTAAMLWRIKNSSPMTRKMRLQEWVTFMEGASPGLFESLLPGAQNDDIVSFMRTGAHGGFERAQQGASAEIAAAGSTVHHHHGLFGSIWQGIEGATQSALNLTDPIKNWHFADNVNIPATRRNIIKSFNSQLQDLTPEQRRQILAPLRNVDATSVADLKAAAHESQTIYVKIHPQAAHYFTTEPAKIQRYYDSRRGAAGSQGMVRPAPVGSGGGSYNGGR